MTETQWRFLQTITERLAPARIVELRLFPSIRQGGVESGVAVVAAEEPGPEKQEAGSWEQGAGEPGAGNREPGTEGPGTGSREPGAEGLEAGSREPGTDGQVVAAGGTFPEGEFEIENEGRGAPPEREVTIRPSTEHNHSIAGGSDSMHPADAPLADPDLDFPELPHAARVVHHVDFAPTEPNDPRGEFTVLRAAAPDGLDPLPQADGDSIPQSNADLPTPSPDAHPADATGGDPSLDSLLDLAMAHATVPSGPRHVRYHVLAARYRLTLKGPDRGRWQFDLTHEADAPLETIERVARGVARRAGDDGEPELYAADAIGSILSQPWWSPTA